MTVQQRLDSAIRVYNQAALDDALTTHGLAYIGDTDLVYASGPIRIRALFRAQDGTHWCDARLVVESTTSNLDDREFWHDQIGGNVNGPCAEVNVFTTWRGKHDALLVPMATAAGLLDLPAPVRSIASWARSWWTMPTVSDRSELAVAELAAAGYPLDRSEL